MPAFPSGEAMERALYDPPQTLSAVQWSEDNLLAVASGATVGLISPCCPEAPRAKIHSGQPRWDAQDPRCQPEGDTDLSYRLNFWRRLAPDLQSNDKTAPAAPVQFAWSPSGFGKSDFGGCLLSVITSDHQVRLLGESPSGQWQAQADLSAQLNAFLANCPVQAFGVATTRASLPGSLSLRGGTGHGEKAVPLESSGDDGGGSSPSIVLEDAIEVTNNEEGLEGSWFNARAEQVIGSFVLARYEDLRVSDDDGAEPLREWFPIQDARPGSLPDAVISSGHPCNSDPGFFARPVPPAQVTGLKKLPVVGQAVEAWDQEGWRPALVKQVKKKAKQVEVSVINNIIWLPSTKLRLPEKWTGRSWHVKQDLLGELSPGEAVQPSSRKRKPPGQDLSQDQISEPAQQPARRGRKRTAAEAAAESSGNAVQEADSAPPSDKADQPQTEAAEDQQIVLADSPSEDSETKDAVRPAKRKRAPKKKRPPPGPKQPHRGSAAIVESYIVPADFDKSLLPSADVSSRKPALPSLGAALCLRFMKLRKQVDAAELPQYKKGQHLQGVDLTYFEQARAEMMSVFASDLERLQILEKTLVMEAKRCIRTAVIKSSGRSIADSTAAVHAEAEDQAEQTEHNVYPGPARPARKRRVVETAPSRDLDDDLLDDIKQQRSSSPSEGPERDEYAKLALQLQKRRASGAVKDDAPTAGTWGSVLFNAHSGMRQHPAVSAELYQKRASLMASTVAAWSDPLTSPSAGSGSLVKVIFLAVGTKLGHVWLWRCRSDQTAPADPSKPHFELMGGCAIRQGCWITALSWAATHHDRQPGLATTPVSQSQLLLACGSSDGSVTLFGQSASRLDSLSALTPQDATMPGSQAAAALDPLATLVTPDLRGMTCLHLQCIKDASGAQTVRLCGGKQAGALLSWQSQQFSNQADMAAAVAGGLLVIQSQAQGTLPISAVTWISPADGQASAPASMVFMATSLDGRCHRWTVTDQKMQEAENFGKGLVMGDCSKVTIPFFGLAPSRCNCYLAIARSSATEALKHSQRKKAHASLLHGVIQIKPLPAGEASAGLHLQIVSGLITGRLRLTAALIWELASLLSTAAKQWMTSAPGASLRDSAAAKIAIPAEKLGPCFCSTVQETLASLEGTQKQSRKSRFKESSQADSVGKLEALQCATAIRHLLHPLRPRPAYLSNKLILGEQATADEGAQPPEALTKWDAAIVANEAKLLQHHVSDCLQAIGASRQPPSGDARTASLLMADWVLKHKDQAGNAADLLQDALATYESLHVPRPPAGNDDKIVPRELVPYTQQPVHLTGSLLESAKTAHVNLEGAELSLQRCAATMLLIPGVPERKCGCCLRSFGQTASSFPACNSQVLLCPFCGVRPGAHAASCDLVTPALC
ncbi:hypothetical protein WJX74_007124 [Apatococcus lobatus]|uniref:Uncharacterized protein n=1 Tax=Apatococcus lobatus TaxID=904363 RepID=A0AAW1QJ85_9CHLO